MNWEALGAIGEIVGAVAVVVTIGYLAVQIRQNSRSVRASAIHASNRALSDLNARIGSNPDSVRILLKGGREYLELSPEERLQYTLLMRAILQIYVDLLLQAKSGLVDIDLFERRKALSKALGDPGAQEWWARNRETYSQEFQEEVAKTLAAEQDEKKSPASERST